MLSFSDIDKKENEAVTENIQASTDITTFCYEYVNRLLFKALNKNLQLIKIIHVTKIFSTNDNFQFH